MFATCSQQPTQVPYPIANINIHPTQVVLVTKRGGIVTLDNDLNISHELSCDEEEDRFLRSFSYPRTRCTFIPNDVPNFGELLVLFLVRRDAIRVRVLRLDDGDGVTQIASVELTSNMVSCARQGPPQFSYLCRRLRISRSVNLETSVCCV